MKVYTILKNIITRFKQGISQCLADAKDYTDTKTEFEDITSLVTVNSTYYNTVSGTARRVGNIGFLVYRLTAKANISSAMSKPILTLPHTGYSLANIIYFGSADTARPLLALNNNQVFQNWSSSIGSGVIVEIAVAYFIVGGVILNLLNSRRVVFA